jgi:cellulose biosynthesis protein BcsQ
MKSIAVFNNKGGVGKTTLLANLASYLAIKMGRAVLIVDADPQCNVTQLMFSDLEVDKLYGDKDTFTIDKIINPLATGKGYAKTIRTSYVFSELLTMCAEYDYVFFDVGLSLGAINRSVLLACDFFISPMSIDIFSLRAIENIRISIEKWRKQLETALSQVEEQRVFLRTSRGSSRLNF